VRVRYSEESEYEKYWVAIDEYLDRIDKEYLSFVKGIHGIKPSGKVLEIGCGRGHILKHFDRLGYGVLGIEMSRKDALFGKNRYGLDIVEGDFYTFDFSDDVFDIILLWGVIEHLNDLRTLMKRIDSMIAQEGLLIINTQVEDWIFIDPFRWINRLFPALAERFGDFIYDKEHLYFFRAKFLVDYLSSHHFTCISEEPQETLFFKYFFRYHSPLLRVISKLAGFFDRIFNSYRKRIFVFQKCGCSQ
jgi:2-polyprenyl-3-methyl-5-hydroxy-6-metoxy-1,4-benzoquinol methylase